MTHPAIDTEYERQRALTVNLTSEATVVLYLTFQYIISWLTEYTVQTKYLESEAFIVWYFSLLDLK